MSRWKGKRVGFVIADDAEEFLAGVQVRAGSVSMLWAKVPDLAERYSSREVARDVARSLDLERPLYVLELYEGDTQFRVAGSGKRLPAWLMGVTA